jgi:hypothetical protein
MIEPCGYPKVAVDFVIPPSLDEDEGGNIRQIDKGFAAVITPGQYPSPISAALAWCDPITPHSPFDAL